MSRKRFKVIFISILITLLFINPVYAEMVQPRNSWGLRALEYLYYEDYISPSSDTGKIYANEFISWKEFYNIGARALESFPNRDYSRDYNLDENISREDAFLIIANYLKLNPDNSNSLYRFKDHNDLRTGKEAILYSLYESKIISGFNDRLRPKDKLTRVELAQVIYNIKHLENMEDPYKVYDISQLENVLYENLRDFQDEIYIINSLDLEDGEYYRMIKKIVLENPDIDYGYNGIIIDNFRELKRIKIYYTDKNIPFHNELLFQIYERDRMDMVREKSQVEERAEEIIKEIITDDMTDVQKEKAIYDWIILNGEYDYDDNTGYFKRRNHTPYGILIDGLGVCESYAKSFYILAKKANLNVLYLEGKVASGKHAWNMVKLDDGEWYHLDSTWGDKGGDIVSYEYFNLRDVDIQNTHKKEESIIKYPEAKGEKYFRDNLSFSENTVIR